MQRKWLVKSQFAFQKHCNMKLTLILALGFCLCALVYGDFIQTKPPFVRSRYSLRWRRTTTADPQSTTGRTVELATSTEHPKTGSSTANSDYDYYGNNDDNNMVHK